MREVKFRGKSVETGEWVYGSLVQEDGKAWIVGGISIEDAGGVFDFYATEWYEVIPETVGQETSLTECENLKQEKVTAFEGDIAKIGWSDQVGECHSTTIVIKNPFDYEINEATHLNYSEYVVIIGNIHDNPELLEVAK